MPVKIKKRMEGNATSEVLKLTLSKVEPGEWRARFLRIDIAIALNIRHYEGNRKTQLARAHGLWRERRRIVESSLQRETREARTAAEVLFEVGSFLAKKDVLGMLPEVNERIKGHQKNREGITEKFAEAGRQYDEVVAGVISYLGAPSEKLLKVLGGRVNAYDSSASEALQYYGAALKFQERYEGLVGNANALLRQIAAQQSMLYELGRRVYMERGEVERISQQLKWLKRVVEERGLAERAGRRLERYTLTDIVQKRNGLLIENPLYSIAAEESFIKNKAAALNIIAWQPMLVRRIYEHAAKGYFGLKTANSAKSMEELGKLVAVGMAVLRQQKGNIPKELADPDVPKGKTYALAAESVQSMTDAKNVALEELKALGALLQKGDMVKITKSALRLGQLNYDADRRISATLLTEMEKHFDRRPWWDKYKRTLADLSVIGLGILGEFASGGTATPLILAAEAAYFAGTHTVDYVGRYMVTKQLPTPTEVLGTLAMVLVPGGRVARELIVLKSARMLGEELRLALGAETEIYRRLAADALFRETAATRVITLSSDIAGKYLLGSMAISLMVEPSAENAITNAAFLAMGSTRAVGRALRKRSRMRYTTGIDAVMRGDVAITPRRIALQMTSEVLRMIIRKQPTAFTTYSFGAATGEFISKIAKDHITKRRLANAFTRLNDAMTKSGEAKKAVDIIEGIAAEKKAQLPAGAKRLIAEWREVLRYPELHDFIIDIKNIKPDETVVGTIIFLDTSYFHSILKSAEKKQGRPIQRPIETTVRELYNRTKEAVPGEDVTIIITREVLAELSKQVAQDRLSSTVIAEIHSLIYGSKEYPKPIALLEAGETSKETESVMPIILKRTCRKGNARIGNGDMSIVQLIKDMGREYRYLIMTTDSDFASIFGGRGRVLVGQGM